MILLCISSIQTCMCTGYLPEVDGPYPRQLMESLELQRILSYMVRMMHDRRLHKFMKVAREHGLVLNKKKCEIKSNSVKFFGCVYDKHRAHPDPSKVSAIKEMPAPQNKGEHQSFLGMLTYTSHHSSYNYLLTQQHSEDF